MAHCCTVRNYCIRCVLRTSMSLSMGVFVVLMPSVVDTQAPNRFDLPFWHPDIHIMLRQGVAAPNSHPEVHTDVVRTMGYRICELHLPSHVKLVFISHRSYHLLLIPKHLNVLVSALVSSVNIFFRSRCSISQS